MRTERRDRPTNDSPVEQRLAALRPLVTATARRWADHYGRDAEDLAQEIILAFWRHLSKRPDIPTSYLVKVARGTCIDALRREKSPGKVLTCNGRPLVVHKLVSLDALWEEDDGGDGADEQDGRRDWLEFQLARRFRSDVPRPTEELALARILEEELRRGLSPRLQRILDLHILGYVGREIGPVEGLSKNQADRLVGAIRRRLQALLKDGADGEGEREGKERKERKGGQHETRRLFLP